MQDKIIEISATTGLDWMVQSMSIIILLIQIIIVIGLGILICKGIHALNIYIKNSKK